MPRILVAPLDWGLGHATRCVPIIQTLLRLNADVVIAASGPSQKLLEEEFPSLMILPLPGYDIQYSKYKNFFFAKIFTQLPKLLAAIHAEKKWLKRIIDSENIDGIISDNRLGLSAKNIHCVFITHQLRIKSGYSLLDNMIQHFYYKYIDRFSACWVPDHDGNNNLAGTLSHPKQLPKTAVDYIGLLSRCNPLYLKKKYDFLLLVSGPEPQRRIFENLLLHIFKDTEYSLVLVRGLPGNPSDLSIKIKNGIVYNHLPSIGLNELIQQCTTVIARSGYSTIMDLVRLRQQAVLIPTPGQTEQEYLAKYLMQKEMFHYLDQSDLSLLEINKALHVKKHSTINSELREEVIRDWLENVKRFQEEQ
ncbi:MAG: glycosyltransferase [Ferruginibacter sp.]